MTRLAALVALLVGHALLHACKPALPPSAGATAVDASFAFSPERVIVRSSESPVIELRLVFEAGSADDPAGYEGLTYVMLKSMLEGRAGALSYAERARALYPMAAVLDGQLGREQLVLVARVHRDHVQSFYPLLRDLLLAPAFDAADVERVRTRALASLTQDLRGGDDEELGKQTLQAMLYEGDPRAHPELGTERGLVALHVKDVAEQWARLVCASRLSLALSGQVSDAFVSTLKTDLAALERPACQHTPALPAPAALAAPRVWLVDKPEAQSIAISLGLPVAVTRQHEDYAALTLAAAYLGQHRTFAGRLMQQVREQRGLNYGDYAYAEHFEQDGDSRFPAPNVARRHQYFSIWIRPVPAEQAHFTLRLVMRELRAFVHEGLSEEQFTRIQRFADGYYALFAQTEQQRLGNALDDRFYSELARGSARVDSELARGSALPAPYLDSLRAAFRALTREQLNAAVKRHLALDKLQIAIVTPAAASFAAALVKGEPSPIKYASEKPASVLEADQSVVALPLGLSEEQLRIVPVAQMFY